MFHYINYGIRLLCSTVVLNRQYFTLWTSKIYPITILDSIFRGIRRHSTDIEEEKDRFHPPVLLSPLSVQHLMSIVFYVAIFFTTITQLARGSTIRRLLDGIKRSNKTYSLARIFKYLPPSNIIRE